MKYAWIDSQRDSYPLQSMYKQLGLSTSRYAKWKTCGGLTHWLSDEQLFTFIRAVHAQYKQTCGSPRMTVELNRVAFLSAAIGFCA